MRRNLIVALIVGVVAASAGIGAGTYIASQLKPPIVLGGSLNGADYEADMNAAWKKYNAALPNGNFVETMTPDQLINCAYGVYAKTEKHHSVSVGVSIASTLGVNVNQRICDYQVRVGDTYFEEQSSVSNLVALNYRFYEKGNETIKYWGSKGDYENYVPETVTNEKYREEMGSNVSRPLRYIVSEKTVIYGKLNNETLGLETTRAKKVGDQIVVDVELHTRYAICYYGVQMKTMSNLYTLPTFDYLHLTVTMSAKDLMIDNVVIHEGYQAILSSGIGSPCTSRVKTIYYTDGDEVIPEVTDKITYPAEL